MELLKLFTPGPLEVSDSVKVAMLHDIGSRDEQLIDITHSIRSISLELVNALADHECIPIHGSGTFGIEAVIDTFIGKDDKPLLLINGMYGVRISEILEKKGIPYGAILARYNEIHDLNEVEECIIDNNPTHLLFVYCETTTGIQNPFHDLVMLAKKHGLKTVIDGVSAFGALPVDAQKTPFDVLVTSSNKCIESVPGISLCIVSRSTLLPLNSKAMSYCLDLCDQWRLLNDTGQWRFTPPTHILQALNIALTELKKETVEKRYERYKANMNLVIRELSKVGLCPCVDSRYQSPICLAFGVSHLEGSFNFQVFYRELKLRGILIYHKMDESTQSFRIGCIGELNQGDFQYLTACVKDLINQFTCVEEDKVLMGNKV